MKIDFDTTTPSHAALLQSFDQQLSLLSDKGFPHRHFNAHVLAKFGGDVEKAQEHLEKVRQQRQEKRAETLEVYKSSVDQLTERGFGDHPCLPRLLKKFDGDVEQIIARIEKKTNKARDPSRQSRPCHKWSRNSCWTPVASSDDTTSSSSSSSSSAPACDEETEITSHTMVDQGEAKCERKAKMQLRQQIKELQGQMRQMQDENAAQARFRQQKKQQRLENFRQREAKILSKLADLKQKASKVNATIQKHEEQLEKVRSFQAKFTTEA